MYHAETEPASSISNVATPLNKTPTAKKTSPKNKKVKTERQETEESSWP